MLASPLALACLLAALGGAAAARARGTPADSKWKEAVAEAKEVSELWDRIQETQTELSHRRSEFESKRGFHEHQSESIEQQISIRKQQVKALEEELKTYEARQQKHYANKMCMLLMHAFHISTDPTAQEAKVEVLKICHGLKPLSLVSLSPGRRDLLADNGTSLPAVAALAEMGRTLHGLETEEKKLEHDSAAAGSDLRGPEQMRTQLQQMEELLAKLRSDYATEAQQWEEERAKLTKEERELGDRVTELHNERDAAAGRAANKTKEQFCPELLANYGVNEDKVLQHTAAVCSA